MTMGETILLFDSGLGGLTVYREVAAARPHVDFLYVADVIELAHHAGVQRIGLLTQGQELSGE